MVSRKEELRDLPLTRENPDSCFCFDIYLGAFGPLPRNKDIQPCHVTAWYSDISDISMKIT
jgi:hypothetical protein